ncbi:MAG: hypothetical protein JOY87_07350 [Candidatus Eremiobacteraeota bacterium]|nr:hypothetical protein [Candidatus Eremiobacteraeota bacterium]MBV8340464.1 hypothetical protein [Candidatus Eremiobacteraeota bacterium]
MLSMRTIYAMTLACLALITSLAPAAPATEIPRNTQLIYECQVIPRYRKTAPWTGVLLFKVNDEGILNGEWRDNSVRPDPFYGSIILVNGGISGDFIKVRFGTSGEVTVKGKISDEGIIGTLYQPNNKTYDFKAVRVTRE